MKHQTLNYDGTANIIKPDVSSSLSLIEISSVPSGTWIDYYENGVKKRAYGSQAKNIYRDIYIEKYGTWENIPDKYKLTINMLMMFGG